VADEAEYRQLKEEARRYRRAAHDALEQLDWCIGYLHGSRKTGVAAALARNRSYIRTNLLDEAAEPSPSAVTSEA
jgi:hypothetical protein